MRPSFRVSIKAITVVWYGPRWASRGTGFLAVRAGRLGAARFGAGSRQSAVFTEGPPPIPKKKQRQLLAGPGHDALVAVDQRLCPALQPDGRSPNLASGPAQPDRPSRRWSLNGRNRPTQPSPPGRPSSPGSTSCQRPARTELHSPQSLCLLPLDAQTNFWRGVTRSPSREEACSAEQQAGYGLNPACSLPEVGDPRAWLMASTSLVLPGRRGFVSRCPYLA